MKYAKRMQFEKWQRVCISEWINGRGKTGNEERDKTRWL